MTKTTINIDQVNKVEETDLYKAARKENLEAIRILLQHFGDSMKTEHDKNYTTNI